MLKTLSNEFLSLGRNDNENVLKQDKNGNAKKVPVKMAFVCKVKLNIQRISSFYSK